MKFITKLGVTCATIAMMASTMTFAGTVTSTQLEDNYIGADGGNTSYSDYTPTNNGNYDTHWMQVSRNLENGMLTVAVNSDFIGYYSKFKLGDLFLMDADNYNAAASCLGNAARGCSESSYTSGTNKWEYAFDLGLNLGNTNIKNSTSNYNNVAGQLRDINTSGNVTRSSSDYHQSVNTSSQLSDGVRSWQIVDVKGSSAGVGDGTWSTDVASKLLTMSFDISGTSLMDAEQIALRWAMSCANDIIEVVTNFKSRNTQSVPEPSTVLLMLLAGLALFASRQKKGFKA